MSLSLFLLLGMIGVAGVILFRRPFLFKMGRNNKLVHLLQQSTWYQNHWLGGGFIFVVNAALFGGVILALFLVTKLTIPFLHLIIMTGGVIGSIVLWTVMNSGWQGSKKNRLKMGLLGSSFYLVVAFVCLYKMITLKPSFPGDDPFMAFIGLLFALFVTTVAFVTCFIFTGLPNVNKVEK